MSDLGLGSAQLIMMVLSGCLQGYRLFTEAKRLGSESQTLLWKFRIQEARLKMWGKEWGIFDAEANPRLKMLIDEGADAIIMETLLRISDILKGYKELKEKYGLRLVVDDPSIALRADTMDELMTNSFEEYHRQDSSLQMQRHRAAGFLKRFRWAISDKVKFERIVSDLEGYNDALYKIFSSMERCTLRQGLSSEVVFSNDIQDLQAVEFAAEHHQSLALTASLRHTRIVVENQEPVTWSSASILSEQLQIDVQHLRFVSRGINHSKHDRDMAGYGLSSSTTVMVEWKHLGHTGNSDAATRSLSRMDGLARLLHSTVKPKELRVPYCLGYIHDSFRDKVGLVFEVPGFVPNILPNSLYDLLKSSKAPYLGSRFRLAHQLCLSVSMLHTAGWLHKAIRSDNVVFFDIKKRTNEDSKLPSLEEPRLIGFDSSRPNDPSIYTELAIEDDLESNRYRHPSAQGSARHRFCKTFDVYALGVVLLEIAFWRPISEFWTDRYTMEAFKTDLCEFHVKNLGNKVGKIYMDAVARCLEGDFEDQLSDADDVEGRMQTGFYWKVVRELARLVA